MLLIIVIIIIIIFIIIIIIIFSEISQIYSSSHDSASFGKLNSMGDYPL